MYDCSCQISKNQPRLNDCLEVGPPLINDLCLILICFHIHKYGVTTDIEKAFTCLTSQGWSRLHPVSMAVKARGPREWIWGISFKVVPFGSASLPFMLNATLNLHLKSQHSDIADDILKNLYVDDLISGAGYHRRECHSVFQESQRYYVRRKF